MQLAIAYIPCPNASSAKLIAKTMIEKKLAVCGNVIPEILSVYPVEEDGQQQISQDMEALLLLKHDKQKFAELVAAIEAIHSYDIPCVTQLETSNTNADYLQWCASVIG